MYIFLYLYSYTQFHIKISEAKLSLTLGFVAVSLSDTIQIKTTLNTIDDAVKTVNYVQFNSNWMKCKAILRNTAVCHRLMAQYDFIMYIYACLLLFYSGFGWSWSECDPSDSVSQLSTDDIQKSLCLQAQRRRTVDSDGQSGVVWVRQSISLYVWVSIPAFYGLWFHINSPNDFSDFKCPKEIKPSMAVIKQINIVNNRIKMTLFPCLFHKM